MSFSDILWIFIMITALQPMLRQRLMVYLRQRKIAQIQAKRGSRLITLVHRQETMRLLGFPVMRFIDIEDAEAVIRAIHLARADEPLDLVLHTPGGSATAALQIARALAAHPAQVTVFVPHIAMSGGTLVALAANQIVMSPHAMLGPVDPQLNGLPASSILRVLRDKPIAEIDDQTIILADVAGKATQQLEAAARELLERHMDGARAGELAKLLSHGTWTHDYPITAEAARGLGLPVSTAMPEEILDLMELYPQPARTAPSVDYLPEPSPPAPTPSRPRARR